MFHTGGSVEGVGLAISVLNIIIIITIIIIVIIIIITIISFVQSLVFTSYMLLSLLLLFSELPSHFAPHVQSPRGTSI